MSRKPPAKPNWEMTIDELRAATKVFDEALIARGLKALLAAEGEA
jgi:hypothetical protein